MNLNVKGILSNNFKKYIFQRMKRVLIFNTFLLIILSQYVFVSSSSTSSYSINVPEQEIQIERRIINNNYHKFNLQGQKQFDYIINDAEEKTERLTQSLNSNTERVIAKSNQKLDNQKLNNPSLSIFEHEPSTSLSYTFHSPITISGNDDFVSQAISEGWIGSGTESDPYIISGLNITPSGTETGISIYNTSLFFIIENCMISGGQEGACFNLVSNAYIANTSISDVSNNGLGIYNSSNIFVDNCSMSNSTVGIIIYSSSTNIEVKYCNIFNTSDNGVQIDGNSRYITGTNNVFRNVLFGYHVMHSCYNITITGNQFYEIAADAAVLSDWESSLNFTISENIFFNRSRLAINDFSYNNIVSNNTFYGGTLFIRGDNNKVFNNLFISDGEAFGQITLNDGSSNEIKENIMQASITISNLTNTFIENNVISSLAIYQDGISIFGSSYITVKNNTIHNITKGSGISVSESFNVDMIDNSIGFIGLESDQRDGISLYFSSNLSIAGNEFFNVTRMGVASYRANFTIIEKNFFYNISAYGIHFPAPNFNNIFVDNTFTNMLDRAMDIGGTNNSIQYNIIQRCKSYGITLPSLSSSKLTNNIITEIGANDAISSYWLCTNLEISNNFISNAHNGIMLFDSLDIFIINNTITNIDDDSISISFTGSYLIEDFNSVLKQITIYDNKLAYSINGIRLNGMSTYSIEMNIFIYGNYISDITDNGIFILEYIGTCNAYNNSIQTCGWAAFELWHAENIIITNNSISYCDLPGRDSRSIQLDYSSNILINENTIVDNNLGMFICVSKNSTITENSFISNKIGIIISNEGEELPEKIIVTYNNFIDNIFFGKQADDSGHDNLFSFNYWSDHSNIDTNGDGIADDPYYLAGDAGNADYYPLVDKVGTQLPSHILSNPSITYPFGGITLSGTIKIKWDEAIDSLGHEVTYDLYYSKDSGYSWTLFANDITGSSYNWDTTTVPDGDNYKLKIIAREYQGLTSEGVTSGSFKIKNSQTSISSDDSKQTVDVSSWSISISIFSLLCTLFIIRKRFLVKKFKN